MIDEDSFDLFAYEMQWPFSAYAPDKLNPRLLDLLKRGRAVSEAQSTIAPLPTATPYAPSHKISPTGLTVSSRWPQPAPRRLVTTKPVARHYQVPWSYLGLPCFTLPVMAADDLPVGLQVMGYDTKTENLAALSHWVMETVLT